MKTVVEIPGTKDRANVTCSQCGNTKEMSYKYALKSIEGVCSKCTTTNHNQSDKMRNNQSTQVDIDVQLKNSIDNGLYIIKFTDRRQKCLVKCKHCTTEYERVYQTDIYTQYGCMNCSGVIRTENSRKHKTVKHNDRLYVIFNSMLKRTGEYGNGDIGYTSKNIKVCKEWIEDRSLFFDWALVNGYSDTLTIDRRDNSKGYSPDNCRWTTKAVQSRNTSILRKTNTSGYRGVSYIQQTKDKFRTRITVNNTEIKLGMSFDPQECAVIYDTYVRSNNLEHTTNFTLEELTTLQETYRQYRIYLASLT